VAPERTQRGLEAAVKQEDTFLANSPLSLLKYSQLLWLTELRLQIDAVGHYWDTWVVGYTPEMQTGLLGRYLEDVSYKRLGVLMLASFFTVLFVIALFILAKRTTMRMSEMDTEYLKFCRVMARRGTPRKNGEGPLDYRDRLIAEQPQLEDEIRSITEDFVAANYRGEEGKGSGLKRAVRGLWLRSLTTQP
jgi:hypothetical protein